MAPVGAAGFAAAADGAGEAKLGEAEGLVDASKASSSSKSKNVRKINCEVQLSDLVPLFSWVAQVLAVFAQALQRAS